MRNRTPVANQNKPFQIIPEFIQTSGLSEYYVRKEVKNGTIPHIRSGKTIFINVPLAMERLNRESCKQAGVQVGNE